MTSDSKLRLGPMVALLAVLAGGCGGGGGTSEVGVRVAISAEHGQSDPATGQPLLSAEGAKSFSNSEGIQITLERAYLSIWSVELVSDCSGSQFSHPGLAPTWAAGIIGLAHAHSQAAPNRISVPHVLALRPADGTGLGMGEMRPAAGTYCGLIVNLQAADSDAQNLPTDFDMLGRTLHLSGEYRLPGATDPVPFELTTARALLPRQLLLAAPLVLGQANRQASLKLAFAYDRWFDGIGPAGLVAGDGAQLTLLAQNIAASIQALP